MDDEQGSPRPLFAVDFEDGSRFELPDEWQDVFVDYYGFDAVQYPALADRLRFVTGKYVAFQAWPTKYDGLGLEDLGDAQYDTADHYFELWSEWGTTGRQWGKRTIVAPTFADVAEAVMYQSMRSGILGKALQAEAERTGTRPVRVVSPAQFVKELDAIKGEAGDREQGQMDSSAAPPALG
jgi:hypothetical protein